LKNINPVSLRSSTGQQLEQAYTRAWDKEFAARLWAGRQMQRMFGRDSMTGLTISALNHLPPLANFLIRILIRYIARKRLSLGLAC
jgi:hypothetical protein